MTRDEIMILADALETELMRQYRASEWEEAKEVLKGVDYCRLALAACHNPPAALTESGEEDAR